LTLNEAYFRLAMTVGESFYEVSLPKHRYMYANGTELGKAPAMILVSA
jgi:hypothetical protein